MFLDIATLPNCCQHLCFSTLPLFPSVVNIYVSRHCHSSSLMCCSPIVVRWCTRITRRNLSPISRQTIMSVILFSVCSQISVSFDTFIKTTATTLELCVHLCRRGLSARGLRLLRLQSHRRTSTRPSVVIWDLSVSSSSREGEAEGSDGIFEEEKKYDAYTNDVPVPAIALSNGFCMT